jgi:transcriptional regulator with XRE-family HTH domain
VLLSPVYLRVRELREAKGLTQVELAARAKVRQATVSAIENEETRRVDLDVLERLAVALDVDPGFLVVRTNKRPRK